MKNFGMRSIVNIEELLLSYFSIQKYEVISCHNLYRYLLGAVIAPNTWGRIHTELHLKSIGYEQLRNELDQLIPIPQHNLLSLRIRFLHMDVNVIGIKHIANE